MYFPSAAIVLAEHSTKNEDVANDAHHQRELRQYTGAFLRAVLLTWPAAQNTEAISDSHT